MVTRIILTRNMESGREGKGLIRKGQDPPVWRIAVERQSMMRRPPSKRLTQ